MRENVQLHAESEVNFSSVHSSTLQRLETYARQADEKPLLLDQDHPAAVPSSNSDMS